jgi:hypothetical protein
MQMPCRTWSKPDSNLFRQNNLRNKRANLLRKFISKTAFLSFPGLTGESRNTLDARLRTSGMTYKDVACDVTNNRIIKNITDSDYRCNFIE